MTEQKEQISFGEYLKSQESSTPPPDENMKQMEEENNIDDNRLQRINEIVGVYENQAKESEEILAKKKKRGVLDKINAEVAAMGNDPNYSLGDVEQFVTELREDLPENMNELLVQKNSDENAVGTRYKKPHKTITIDLFAVQKAELEKKHTMYGRRKTSPTARVHERLFAHAQEKDARIKLTETNVIVAQTFKPVINKMSTELLRTKNRPETTVDV